MAAIDVTVQLRGGLFGNNIPKVVQRALVDEVIVKVEPRVMRGGKGIGSRKNTITTTRSDGGTTLDVATTKINPRRTGGAWQRKNIGIVRSMAPRVMKKAAERIAVEMG